MRSVTLCFTLVLPSLLLAQGPGRQDAPPARRHTIDAATPQGLQQLFRYDREALPLVSAHRGGARRGFPENCLQTFDNALRRTWAIVEVDPRYTKDGAIVLHHDASLERTTTGTGRVADYSLRELKELRLKDAEGKVTDFQIPTLDEALAWARGKTILVLDQKDVPVAARVKKIEEHSAESFAMLIVYNFDAARECYSLNENLMMEVMIPDRRKFEEFDETGVPWSNVVAFVGHNPPQDEELLRMIHAKGACCIAGTSRNLDLALAKGDEARSSLQQRYRELLSFGVDFLETDLPGDVGQLLFRDAAIPAAKSQVFRRP